METLVLMAFTDDKITKNGKLSCVGIVITYAFHTDLSFNSGSNQCSTTGVTKVVVCIILSVG